MKFWTLWSCLAIVLCGCGKKEALKGTRESIEGITYTELDVSNNLKNIPIVFQTQANTKEIAYCDGNSSNLSVNHSLRDNPKIKWSKRLGRKFFVSNILVFDGHIYAMKENGNLCCLRQDDGKQLWQSEIANQPLFGSFSGGIAFHGTTIYIATNTSDVVAFDISKRKVIWKQPIEGTARGEPIYISDRIIVNTTSNKTYALNAKDGHVLWTYSTSKETLSINLCGKPAVYNKNVICVYSNGDVVSLRVSDGTVNWTEVLIPKSVIRSGATSIFDASTTPIVIGDKVFVISAFSTMSLFDARTGMRLWSKDIGSMSQPAVVNKDWVFLLSDMDLVCISLKDGNIMWHVDVYKTLTENSRAQKKRTLFGPLIVNNQIWILNELGNVFKFAISTGKFLGENIIRNVKNKCTPIVIGETMYGTGNGKLYAIE